MGGVPIMITKHVVTGLVEGTRYESYGYDV